jgi:hypothetical protein
MQPVKNSFNGCVESKWKINSHPQDLLINNTRGLVNYIHVRLTEYKNLIKEKI